MTTPSYWWVVGTGKVGYSRIWDGVSPIYGPLGSETGGAEDKAKRYPAPMKRPNYPRVRVKVRR